VENGDHHWILRGGISSGRQRNGSMARMVVSRWFLVLALAGHLRRLDNLQGFFPGSTQNWEYSLKQIQDLGKADNLHFTEKK